MLTLMNRCSYKKQMLLLLILILSLWTSPGELVEEAFCAGVRYDVGPSLEHGMESMGGENIYLKGSTLNTIWTANPLSSLIEDEDRVEITLTGVTDPSFPKGVVNGWLAVSVKHQNGNKFAALAIWALTYDGDSFGEFVHPDVADCIEGAGGGKGSWTSKINYLPCSAVPIHHPMNPNMFIYAKNPPATKSEFNLLWRVSVTYCNFVKNIKFRFMVAASGEKWESSLQRRFHPEEGETSKLGPLFYTTEWITPKFFGQAGPVPADGKFACMATNHISRRQLPWLQKKYSKSSTRQLRGKWLDVAWVNKVYLTKVGNPRSVCKAAAEGSVPFGGRCETWTDLGALNSAPNRVYGNVTLVQKCQKPNAPANPKPKEVSGEHYKNFVENWFTELLKNCMCPSVPSKEEVVNAPHSVLKGRQGKGDEKSPSSIDRPENPYFEFALMCHGNLSGIDPNEAGICLDSAAGKVVYGVRQWHSVSMMFCVLVINPIVSFTTRYNKGHFTTHGPIHTHAIPLRPWYKLHIITILPTICMYATSVAAIGRQNAIFGFSVTSAGSFHRLGGWFLFVLIVFQVLTGPVRPQNTFCRKIIIFLHWAGGWTNHYFGLLICIMSYRIPGSPTSFHSHVAEREKFHDITYSPAAMLLVVWSMTDIVFHIFLTFQVIRFDKKMGIRRSHFPIILPNLLNKTDVPVHVFDLYLDEERFCQRVTKLYTVMASVTFIFYCVSIYSFNTGYHQGFGRMYCTHGDDGVIGAPDRSAESWWYC